MDTITAIVAQKIKAYPTLYASRADVLLDLASKSPEYRDEIFWREDGTVEVLVAPDSPDKAPEDEDCVVSAKADLDAEMEGTTAYTRALRWYNQELLRYRRYDAERKFVRDNAELLAQSETSFVSQVPGYRFRFLEAMPENANQLWVQAFIEMAEEVLRYKFPAGKFDGYIDSYRESYESRLQTAKDSAEAFLIRVRGTPADKKALAKKNIEAEIAALVKKAAVQGVKVEATVA